MRASRHRVSERGFSMVELLVAMLIALIGMIIIFQVFEVSESIKRSTTSGGDSQQNGVIALYTMKLAPVFITSGAASTTPDQISVLYGSQPQATASVPLATDMTVGGNGMDALNVTTPYGYNPGDVLLVGQINVVPPRKCSIMEYTSPGGTSNVLNHVTTDYLLGGVNHTPRFNKPTGLGIEYNNTASAVTRVFNLGNL